MTITNVAVQRTTSLPSRLTFTQLSTPLPLRGRLRNYPQRIPSSWTLRRVRRSCLRRFCWSPAIWWVPPSAACRLLRPKWCGKSRKRRPWGVRYRAPCFSLCCSYRGGRPRRFFGRWTSWFSADEIGGFSGDCMCKVGEGWWWWVRVWKIMRYLR